MVGSFDTALEIAQYLAKQWWFRPERSLSTYVAGTFGHELPDAPVFDRIYIAEAETGDAPSGVIGGLIRRWWVVDDSGMHEADVEEVDFSVRGRLYASPVVKFFVDGDVVAIGERLGPELACRKVGRYFVGREPCIGDVRTVWVSRSSDL